VTRDAVAGAVAALHPDFLGETARRIGLQRYEGVRQFVVQHLYPDTARLLLLLHEHVPIADVVSIGYSGDPDVVRTLRAHGITVHLPAAREDLDEVVAGAFGACLERCAAQGHRLIIHEVGGYTIRALHERFADRISRVIGAIEVTKQGVWVAQSLPELRVPQLNCAQTRLKRIEGGQVGEAVVAALDTILREIGFALVGREALVCGYGWVGRGVAHSLSRRGMRVSVADTDPVACVEATVDGFGLYRPGEIDIDVGTAEDGPDAVRIVIGASGRTSIDAALLDRLPDRCFLVSGASKDHEIDLRHLALIATGPPLAVHEHIDAWPVNGARTLYLVNRGYPVNFTGASVPDEIVEFLFAELVMLVQELLERTPPPGIHPLAPEREAIAAGIWLDLR